jgi:hypothetical protein
MVINAFRDGEGPASIDTNKAAAVEPGPAGTPPAARDGAGASGRSTALPDRQRQAAPRQAAAPAPDDDDEGPQREAMPIGTVLRAQIITELRGDRSLAGHEFDATLSEPLVWNGATIAAAGTPLKGLVNEVHPGGSNSPPILRLSLTSIHIGGVATAIRTARYQVVAPDGTKLAVPLPFKLAAPLPFPLKSS